MKIFYIFLIILASIFEYLGDSNFKFFSRDNTVKNFIYGIISYIILIGLLIYILKFTNVMYMNLTWDSVSIILETLLAFILLKERLTNNFQWTGLILVIVGVLFLSYGKIPK